MNNENHTADGDTEIFPALPLTEWQATRDTLHLWTQIVGKIRMANTPLVNHFWNTTLYLAPRGLTTSAIPYKSGNFEIEFDFVNHQLIITTSSAIKTLALKPQTVAEFYRNLVATLRELGIDIKIRAIPDEIPEPIPFAEDTVHKSYDAEYANRFWRILVSVDKIFKEFRARFVGKCSPVHFFWGSFDLAVTRFSGRRAPEREGADSITREAYSHEVISHGFWTGSPPLDAPAFYSYTAPEPDGLKQARIFPAEAFYSKDFNEFIFNYDDMRQSDAPEKALIDFLQSTYEAGANLADWERAELERVK
ncbi:MAG: DUF5996 family protein [Acidobacteriota bacterium]|nr:DUF5996 family protein [Acidobacteriota bacterium]